EAVERHGKRSRGGRCDDRLESREHALTIGLAERDEPHAGRDETGGEAMQEGNNRRFNRNAVTRSRRGDGNRIGARSWPNSPQPIERGTGPCRLPGDDERIALCRRLEVALLRGREGSGQFGYLTKRPAILVRHCPM